MTTTDLYSGYTADGKPSSRVLRPPGGGSSNIFGGAEPEAPREQVRREMAQQSPATQTQSPSNPTTDANNEYQKNKPKGKVQYNPITGEEYPADYGQQKGEEKEEQEKNEDEETEKDKDESTDSPTDENNSATEQQEATPAPVVETTPAPFQKVRQPPGGKSSGLW